MKYHQTNLLAGYEVKEIYHSSRLKKKPKVNEIQIILNPIVELRLPFRLISSSCAVVAGWLSCVCSCTGMSL